MDQCDEAVRLSEVVIQAVEAVYQARQKKLDAAEKGDADGFDDLLLSARETARLAVKALDEHRKQCGCRLESVRHTLATA